MKSDIDHFTKKLHGRTVLDDVNIHFDSEGKGLIVGLQGINGSGKTMLIRALCGLIYATQGTLSVDGQILGKDISFPPSVGALIENPAFLNEYTGRRNLELLSSIRGRLPQGHIDEALNAVGLNPNDHRAYRKYSLGMKQRLGIAAAILEKPQLLLLDEPFNALDQDGVEQVAHVIQEQRALGKMVFLACHDANELYNLSDIVITMKNGAVASEERIRQAGE
mgnify:FL=1